MNAAVNALYAEYLEHTGGDKAAAASLTLAAVMFENGHSSSPPTSLTPEEAAARLRLNRKTVYGLCQRRALRSYRAGRHLRIPLEEIERIENASGARDRAPRFPDVIKRYY